MTRTTVLLEGRIDPNVKKYWLWTAPVVFGLTIVLIPLIPIYVIVASLVIDRYLANIECRLTERNLIINKGILNKVESTLPIAKITDLQLYQGPVMRFLGSQGFRVETAGQSAGPGAHLVNMIGIVDTESFRETVLEQRDHIEDRETSRGAVGAADADGAADEELRSVAREIRDTLPRIEARLEVRD